MIDTLVVAAGLALATVGALFDLIAAIGFQRLPDFYSRLHAATIGAIGGASLPLLGIGLLALGVDSLSAIRFTIFATCLLTSVTIVVVSAVASHALARAAYRSGEVKPVGLLRDSLRERLEGSG
ncbi:MAG: monovalent cation/H(+) antiporter subunit G [Acidilobaceae archaeon]